MNETVRQEIADLIGIDIHSSPADVPYTVLETIREDGYDRLKIEYEAPGGRVPAYLLLPDDLSHAPAVLINHQHNSERHFGKSEPVGLVGSPYQAFGPALARGGFVVLVPDVICFEERRPHGHGTEPLGNDLDFWYHLNEMCYRILRGDLLIKRILEDTMAGITLLSALPGVDPSRIGTLGHSMGGNTVQFLAAMDKRIAYACASGSACSFKNRMENDVGIELSSVVPGFCRKYDIGDLIACIAPRKLLIVSAREDKYSRDADDVAAVAAKTYERMNASGNLRHLRYPGGHPLDEARFEAILRWIFGAAGMTE